MKKYILTTVIIVLASLLTSCGRCGTDYAKNYSDYLTYSLGSDGKLSYSGTEKDGFGTHSGKWTGTYTDSKGTPCEFSFDSYDYKEMHGEDGYSSQQQFYDCQLVHAMYDEAYRAASREAASELFSRYFDNADFELWYFYPEKGVKVLYHYLPIHFDTDKAYPLVQEALKPGTGLQVSAAGMKSFAQDPNVLTVISITVTEKEAEGIQPEPSGYVEKMQQIYNDYLQMTGAPQNYHFTVCYIRKAEDNAILSQELLFDKAALTGIGEFSAAERYTENEDADKSFLMRNELTNILLGQL